MLYPSEIKGLTANITVIRNKIFDIVNQVTFLLAQLLDALSQLECVVFKTKGRAGLHVVAVDRYVLALL